MATRNQLIVLLSLGIAGALAVCAGTTFLLINACLSLSEGTQEFITVALLFTWPFFLLWAALSVGSFCAACGMGIVLFRECKHQEPEYIVGDGEDCPPEKEHIDEEAFPPSFGKGVEKTNLIP